MVQFMVYMSLHYVQTFMLIIHCSHFGPADLEDYKSSLQCWVVTLICCLDNKLDMSRVDTYRKMSAGASLVKMLDDINLIGVWRTLKPSARDFTFYSNP